MSVLRALHKFKSPHSKLLTNKHNMTRPFEDVSSVEFLGRVNDCSLFAYASHSKKRPHNLILGRLFDHQLLNMFELGVDPETFQGMDAFDGERKAVVRVGSKPAVLFQGEAWDSSADLVLLRNFLLDFFRGEQLEKINVASLDHVMVFTASSAERIHARHYGVSLKKGGSASTASSSGAAPRVELDEVGPRMDLLFRRSKSAPDALMQEALRQPKSLRALQQQRNLGKNMGRNDMGDKTGTVHMQRQDLSNLNVARLKGLKKRKRGEEEGADDASSAAAMEVDGGAAEPDHDGMTDVSSHASSRATSAASAASSSASSARKRMAGVNVNSMDEFGGSARSVGSVSSNGRREAATDRNLVKKKAAGYGAKPIEGGYQTVAKKKKVA